MYVWLGNASQKCVRERERKRERQGYPPGKLSLSLPLSLSLSLSLSVVLYLARPLQHLFSCCCTSAHLSTYVHCRYRTYEAIACSYAHERAHTYTHTHTHTHTHGLYTFTSAEKNAAHTGCREEQGNAPINNSALTPSYTHLPAV